VSCPLCKPYTLILIFAGLALTFFGSPYDIVGLAVIVFAIILSVVDATRRGKACVIKTPTQGVS
jgi:hypothetical protein